MKNFMKLLMLLTLSLSVNASTWRLANDVSWHNNVNRFGYACHEVYKLVRICAEEGLVPTSCRRDPNGSPLGDIKTEYKCGAESASVQNIAARSECSSYYQNAVSPCSISREQWESSARNCLPRSAAEYRAEHCPNGCINNATGLPINSGPPMQLHWNSWTKYEQETWRSCVATIQNTENFNRAIFKIRNNLDPENRDHPDGNKIIVDVKTKRFIKRELTDLNGVKNTHWVIGHENDEMKFGLSGIRGHRASYCFYREGGVCSYSEFHRIGYSRVWDKTITTTEPSDRFDQRGRISTARLTTGKYIFKARNDSTGRVTTKSIYLIHRDEVIGSGCTPVLGSWEAYNGPEFSPRLPSGDNPPAFYQNSCDCKDKAERDTSGQMWQCKGESISTDSGSGEPHCMYVDDVNGDYRNRVRKYLSKGESTSRKIQLSRENNVIIQCSKQDGSTGDKIIAEWMEHQITCEDSGAIKQVGLPLGSGSNIIVDECGDSAVEPLEAINQKLCTYYHYPNGQREYETKSLAAGRTTTRHLNSRSSGSYTSQTIMCSDDGDTDGVGSGLSEVSKETISTTRQSSTSESGGCTVREGTFCPDNGRETEFYQSSCGTAPAGNWVAQRNNMYHRYTGNTCGAGPAPASSTGATSCQEKRGTFCPANGRKTEWLKPCSGTPSGTGWVTQPRGVFHRYTGSTCSGASTNGG